MEVEYTFLIPGRIRLYVTGLEWCCFNISFASSCLLLLALVVILSCSIVLFLLFSLYRVFLFRLLFVDSNLFLNLRFSTDIFLSLSTEGKSLLVNISDLSLYDLVRLLAEVAESFLVYTFFKVSWIKVFYLTSLSLLFLALNISEMYLLFL